MIGVVPDIFLTFIVYFVFCYLLERYLFRRAVLVYRDVCIGREYCNNVFYAYYHMILWHDTSFANRYQHLNGITSLKLSGK